MLADYRWLVGDEGRIWLQRIEEFRGSLPSQITKLRKDVGADHARLLIEQRELRHRAFKKFEAAGNMFFTRRSLEQATDQWIGRFKAARFPAAGPIADLCCGAGGDMVALGQRGPVVAVDRDPVAALLARANADALGITHATIQVADVATVPVAEFAAWHMDPDRRPKQRRTVRLEFAQPPIDVIRRLINRSANGAVKMAPATVVPEDWRSDCERLWIGFDRECRQQVAWFGELAEQAGNHVAVVIDRTGESARVIGPPDQRIDVSPEICRWLHEPHAAVLAARLTGTLAGIHGLNAVAPGSTYLTGDQLIHDRLLDSFEVLDVLPFDLRRLSKVLRLKGIGQLEVKKRGVPIDPDQVARRLRGSGSCSATLLLVRRESKVTAILAQRATR